MYRARLQRIALQITIFSCVFIFLSGYMMAHASTIYGVQDLGNRFVVRSLDLTNQGLVVDLLTGHKPANERIQSLFLLPDDRLALLRTSVLPNARSRSNIEILGDPLGVLRQRPSDNIRIHGLPNTHAASSGSRLLTGNTQSLTVLVSHFSDTPPFSVGIIDLATSQTTTLPIEINEHMRLNNLSRCPDGVTYATSLGHQGGGPRLVRIALELGEIIEVTKLHIEGKELYDDLKSLKCSDAGEIYALGDPAYLGVNSLFQIDLATGSLNFMRIFNVDLITL